jgi:tetratricopeptide (TPR) repeat protein
MRDREPHGRTGVISIVDQLERKAIARLRAQAEAMHLREAELSVERFESTRAIKDTDYDALIAALPEDDGSTDHVRAARAKLRATRGLQRCLRGDPEAGFAEWAEAIEEAPDMSFPYLVRGRWRMLQEPEAALADYDRAAEVQPTDPLVYWRRGDCYAAIGDQDRALANYRRAAALDPSSLDELQTMAKLLADREEWAEAARAYDRAIALGPKYTDSYVGRARCREALGDFEGAARDHGRILDIDPSRNGTRYSRAWCLAQAGHSERAIEEMERVVAIEPDGHHLHRTLGKLRFEAGRAREAVESLTRAIELEPGDATAHAFLGYSHLVLGERETALADFARAIALAPEDPAHLLGLAIARAPSLPPGEALAELDAILEKHPDARLVVEHRAGVLFKAGAFERALADYDHALSMEPDDADLHIGRARSLGPLGRVEEGYAATERAIALAPDDATARVLRGVFGHHLGKDPVQVTEDYDRAVELAPDDASILATRAEHLQDIEMHSAAIADYDRALAIAPRAPSLYYHRGYSRARIDEEMFEDEDWSEEPEVEQARYVAAAQDFERAIELGRKDDEVYTELYNAHIMRGDQPAALEALDRGMAVVPEADAGLLIRFRYQLRKSMNDLEGAAADRARGEAMGMKFDY